PLLSYSPSASACHTSSRARPIGRQPVVRTAPVSTMGVPLLTSPVKSAFSGESGSKNGPSVWASVCAPLPHAGVGARVDGDPPAAPPVLRGRRLGRSPPPELQAAMTAGVTAAKPA